MCICDMCIYILSFTPQTHLFCKFFQTCTFGHISNSKTEKHVWRIQFVISFVQHGCPEKSGDKLKMY